MSGFQELGLRPGLDEVLRCPSCLGELQAGAGTLVCQRCVFTFPVRGGIPFAFLPTAQEEYLRLDDRRRHQLGDDVPRGSRGGAYHWQTYGFQREIPGDTGGRALLHGCGDGGERQPLEELGFDVVGFDVKRTRGTDFLGDAHCLPLADESFDLVLSTQVFEHLAAPWDAAAEIARVLKPGGWLVGSVAFLKPFHNSYFHISHLGMVKLLEPEGLIIDRLRGAQSLSYSTYGGLLPVGSRPVRRRLFGGVDWVLMRAREAIWAARRRRSSTAETDVFDKRFRFSFRDFDKHRYAPAVVFRAQKRLTAADGGFEGTFSEVQVRRSALLQRAATRSGGSKPTRPPYPASPAGDDLDPTGTKAHRDQTAHVTVMTQAASGRTGQPDP